MKIATVEAIAGLIAEAELNEDYVIPDPFDTRLALAVAASVAKDAMESGVVRMEVDPEAIAEKTKRLTAIDEVEQNQATNAEIDFHSTGPNNIVLIKGCAMR